MCLICVELIKQRMTLREAKRAAKEINFTREGSDHAAELEQAIEEMNLEMLDKILEDGTNVSKI